jgi:two-component system OmpR family response regulator
MTSILVIEDDPETADEIRSELIRLGYTVGQESDGAAGLRSASTGSWDLIVVDRMLPGMDGLTIIREMRKREVLTPVLVLSALDRVDDRIMGLRAGGDDYLVKPFALAELSARLEALVRRPAGGQIALHSGPVHIDLVRRDASRGGRPLDLLQREFQILEYMVRRAGQLVTRQMLLEDIFGYRFELKSNLVDVHMGRLRRKLDLPDETPLLVTVRGEGFLFDAGS